MIENSIYFSRKFTWRPFTPPSQRNSPWSGRPVRGPPASSGPGATARRPPSPWSLGVIVVNVRDKKKDKFPDLQKANTFPQATFKD